MVDASIKLKWLYGSGEKKSKLFCSSSVSSSMHNRKGRGHSLPPLPDVLDPCSIFKPVIFNQGAPRSFERCCKVRGDKQICLSLFGQSLTHTAWPLYKEATHKLVLKTGCCLIHRRYGEAPHVKVENHYSWPEGGSLPVPHFYLLLLLLQLITRSRDQVKSIIVHDKKELRIMERHHYLESVQ